LDPTEVEQGMSDNSITAPVIVKQWLNTANCQLSLPKKTCLENWIGKLRRVQYKEQQLIKGEHTIEEIINFIESDWR
jgi:hypothetical protein